MAATWTGSPWVTGTFIAPTNSAGAFDTFVGNPATMQADVIVDVVGYFTPPTRAGNGLRVQQTTGSFTDAPNIMSGSSANTLITATLQGVTVSGGGASGTTGCLNPNTGGEGPCSHRVESNFGTIAGGAANYVGGSFGTIGGGEANTAGTWATVAGGIGNFAENDNAAVGGGANNRANGFAATIAGGSANTAKGTYAAVAGGTENSAGGSWSFAGGRRAKVRDEVATGESPCASAANCGDEGSFVWADAQDADFTSTGPNQFLVRAAGGVGINTTNPGGVSLRVGSTTSNGNGAFVSNGGVWTNGSSREFKDRFAKLNAMDVLSRVISLPVLAWNYKGTDERHIGPIAEDFYSAFGLGTDKRYIATVDASGVALAAIQGLNQKLVAESAALKAEGKAKDAKIAAQASTLAAQASKLSVLEKKASELDSVKAELTAIKKKLGL
jgi:hypothetical protein